MSFKLYVLPVESWSLGLAVGVDGLTEWNYNITSQHKSRSQSSFFWVEDGNLVEYLEIRRDRTENGLQVFSFHILNIVGDEFTYFTELLVM